jgi:hypothetical protein
MQQSSIIRIKNWRIDVDGMLRVTACVLKEGVFAYQVSDLPPEIAAKFEGKTEIQEYIPASEFTKEALATLEGKPVITNDHEWQTPGKEEQDKASDVGSIAGSPQVKDLGIICDFVITDADAIEKIKNKEYVELSSAYTSLMEVKEGEFEGKHYDVVQHNLKFNHVLLVPSSAKGRCGQEVRILNKESIDMFTLKVTNSTGQPVEYQFTSENDMRQAEKMVENVKVENEAAIVAVKNEETKKEELLKKDVDVKNDEIAAHKTKISELEKLVAEFSAKLKEFASEEYAEKDAEARNEYAKAEESIIKSETKPGEEEKVKNEITEAVKDCEGRKMNARKRYLTVKVMNSRKIDMSKATDSEIAAAFNVLVSSAKARVENKVPGNPVQFKANGTGSNAEHPVYAACK